MSENNVSISKGNSKMGAIPSVSLPSIKTCIKCGCNVICYAKKLERLRKTVKNAYQNNYDILISNEDKYWREVEASIMVSRFFRFHVSGDIPSDRYFFRMWEVAKRNPHCEILCFTKKFSIVNYVIDTYKASGENMPTNLHVIFSGWKGLEMINPHMLPEAHVMYKDGTTTAREGYKECSGNCSMCAVTEDGCWTLKNGEQIVFNQH